MYRYKNNSLNFVCCISLSFQVEQSEKKDYIYIYKPQQSENVKYIELLEIFPQHIQQ